MADRTCRTGHTRSPDPQGPPLGIAQARLLDSHAKPAHERVHVSSVETKRLGGFPSGPVLGERILN